MVELRHIQRHLPALVLVQVCQCCAVWAGPPVRVVVAAEPCQAVCLRQLRLRAAHQAHLVALTRGAAVADGAPGLPAAWLQVLHSSSEDGPARLVLSHVPVAVVWAWAHHEGAKVSHKGRLLSSAAAGQWAAAGEGAAWHCKLVDHRASLSWLCRGGPQGAMSGRLHEVQGLLVGPDVVLLLAAAGQRELLWGHLVVVGDATADHDGSWGEALLLRGQGVATEGRDMLRVHHTTRPVAVIACEGQQLSRAPGHRAAACRLVLLLLLVVAAGAGVGCSCCSPVAVTCTAVGSCAAWAQGVASTEGSQGLNISITSSQ